MATYKTEGIIQDVKIDKSTVTFTLLPVPPYSFEEKLGDEKVKYMLWTSKPESEDEPKVTLTLDDNGVSWGKGKVGKNETWKVQGAILENETNLSLNLQGVPTPARKRDAKLIPIDTKCSFELGSSKVEDLGAFLVLMQNRTKIVAECSVFVKKTIVVSSISIAN